MSDTQPTLAWEVMGASVQGATHTVSGKPNQDAILWYSKNRADLPLILAIADGHGSNKSFRSHIGAKFAVEIAVEELLNFASLTDGISSSTAIKDRYERVPQLIVRRWREKVEAHWSANPPVGKEWEYLNEKEQAAVWEPAVKDHARPYGSTLLAALATKTFLLTMQLGDGDIVLVLENGEVEKPIPPDTRLIANETTSLCTPKAANEFRRQFRLANTLPALVLLSTDGYSNSFNNEAGFLKVGKDIWQMMRAEGGIEKVKSSLQEWLQTATKTGSGDDITLGILYRHEALKKELPSEKPPEEKKEVSPSSPSLEQGNVNKNSGEVPNPTTPANGEQDNTKVNPIQPVQMGGESISISKINTADPSEQQKEPGGSLPGTPYDVTSLPTMITQPQQIDTESVKGLQFKSAIDKSSS